MTSVPETPEPASPTGDVDDAIVDPAEMLRIEAQLEALALELRALGALADDEARARLVRVEQQLRSELDRVLGPSMRSELHRFFDWLGAPQLTADEVRLGLGEMLGWVEGILTSLRFTVVPPGKEASSG